MLRLIRWGMQRDVYVSGNAKQVSFIGTRTDDVEFDSVMQQGTGMVQSQISGNNQQRIVGIIGGLAGVVLLVAFFMFAVARPKPISEEDSPDEAPPVVSKDGSVTSGPSFEEKEQQEYTPWLRKQSAPAPPERFEFEYPKPPPIGELTICHNNKSPSKEYDSDDAHSC
jgi:hypothetical protein